METNEQHKQVAAKLRQLQQQSKEQAVKTHVRPSSTKAGRKLLHWSAEQWKAFEMAPRFTTVVENAHLLPIQTPLSSLYVNGMTDGCIGAMLTEVLRWLGTNCTIPRPLRVTRRRL